jgi:hypothetical protein
MEIQADKVLANLREIIGNQAQEIAVLKAMVQPTEPQE